MAEIKVYFEKESELLTIFWKNPSANQICSELDNGIIAIKDSETGELLGIELLSFQPEDKRITGISLQLEPTTI